ncbi:unnamed protein product, partial [Mesorhabditis spiculigera]
MLILLLTALIFLAAVLTTVVWMLFEMRPARRQKWRDDATRLRKHDETDDKIARQSFEETKYLRRYSELNPQATRRHSFNEEED